MITADRRSMSGRQLTEASGGRSTFVIGAVAPGRPGVGSWRPALGAGGGAFQRRWRGRCGRPSSTTLRIRTASASPTHPCRRGRTVDRFEREAFRGGTRDHRDPRWRTAGELFLLRALSSAVGASSRRRSCSSYGARRDEQHLRLLMVIAEVLYQRMRQWFASATEVQRNPISNVQPSSDRDRPPDRRPVPPPPRPCSWQYRWWRA